MLPDVAAHLAAEARRVAGENPARILTVGRFREATGISRHVTMPMLEFFDRVGFTRRLHDGREIRDEWPEAPPGKGQATLS